jgi:hypothetical protein
MKGRRILSATKQALHRTARAAVAVAFVAVAGSACRTTGAIRAQEPDPQPVSSSGEEWVRPTRVTTVTRPGDVARAEMGIRRDAPTSSAISKRPFISRKDSLEYMSAYKKARDAKSFRVVVSLFDRQLWVINDQDTSRVAPVATVLRALPKKGYRLSDGRRLTVRDSVVGVIVPGYEWAPLPIDEEIVFQNTLFIPPLGTKNRRIDGELGKFRLDLGDGFLIHGTPYENSIGTASTHGCVRLRDEDIEWLYNNVPVGTHVYIY